MQWELEVMQVAVTGLPDERGNEREEKDGQRHGEKGHAGRTVKREETERGQVEKWKN